MSGIVCPVISDQAKAISKASKGKWNAKTASNYLRKYEELQGGQKFNDLEFKDLPIEEQVTILEKIEKTLVSYEGTYSSTNMNNISMGYTQLRMAIPSVIARRDRINSIAYTFAELVASIQKKRPDLSTESIVKGIRSNGATLMGADHIYNHIYKIFYQKYLTDPDNAAEYLTIFANWGALVALSKVKVKELLGTPVGIISPVETDGLELDVLEQAEYSEEIDYVLEEAQKEGWHDLYEQQSAFKTSSIFTKRLLQYIPEVSAEGTIVKDDLGFTKYKRASTVHTRLLNYLGYVKSEKVLLQKMKQFIAHNPAYNSLYSTLQTDAKARTTFLSDFKKVHQNYSQISYKRQADGTFIIATTVLNNPKGTLASEVYLNNVRNLQLPFHYKADGKTPIEHIYDVDPNTQSYITNTSNISKLRRLIQDKFNVSETENKAIEFIQNTPAADRVDLYTNILLRMGAHIPAIHLKEITEKPGMELQLLSEFNNFAKSAIGAGKAQSSSFLVYVKKTGNTTSSPYLDILGRIITTIQPMDERYLSEGRITYQGDPYSSKVLPSMFTDFADTIKELVMLKDSKGLQEFIDSIYGDSPFFKGKDGYLNVWLNELYNSDLNDPASFANNFDYDRMLGSNTRKLEDFSDLDRWLLFLNKYLEPSLQTRQRADYATYPSFTLGDSSAIRFTKAPNYTKEEVLDHLVKVARQEVTLHTLRKEVDAYLTEQGHSTFVNFTKDSPIYSYLPMLESLGSTPTDAQIKETIVKSFSSEVDTLKLKLFKEGVFDQTTTTINGVDYNKFQYIDNINTLMNVILQQEGVENITQEKMNDRLDSILEEYFYNHQLAMMMQLQLSLVSPAFYKNSEEMQKRYKAKQSAGIPLSPDAVEVQGGKRNHFSRTEVINGVEVLSNIEKCIYIEDMVEDANDTHPEFITALEKNNSSAKTMQAYRKNSSTNGQGLRTPEGYKRLLGSLGQWRAPQEYAYNKIQEIRERVRQGNKLSAADIAEIEKARTIFQPTKPLTSGMEKIPLSEGRVFVAPVQHKYAEILLIPELEPEGSKLRIIGEWMSENDIDMLCSTEAVKEGVFGVVNIDGINDAKQLKDRLSTGYVHNIQYSNVRIMTNFAEHNHDARLFPTQIRKISLAKLDTSGKTDYMNYFKENPDEIVEVRLDNSTTVTRMSGRDLIYFYNSLISSNILEATSKYEKLIASTEGVSTVLTRNAVTQDGMEDFIIGASLDANPIMTGKPLNMSLSSNTMSYQSINYLLSTLKKSINKQKILGGAAVQSANLGKIDGTEDLNFKVSEDGSNIIYSEVEIAFDIKIQEADGTEVALEYNDWVNPDRTLKTDKNGVVLLEKFYPGILDMVFIRVPTEDNYSIIRGKIARFAPKALGGTVKVPKPLITAGGFDLDGDKLYYIRKSFKKNQMSPKSIEKVWDALYTHLPHIKDELLAAKAKSDKVHARLHEYWNEADLPNLDKQVYFNRFATLSKAITYEEYDFSKTPLDNTKLGRDNMLLNIILHRLEDPATFKSRTTPQGFDNAIAASNVLKELMFGEDTQAGSTQDLLYKVQQKDWKDPKPSYSPTNPSTLIEFANLNNLSKKLIGLFANQNTHAAITSLLDNFVLTTPLVLGDTSIERTNLKEGAHVDIAALTEFLASSVDAVKQAVLAYLNFNLITANPAAVLARVGFNITEIGLFFNQPIIKEFCKEVDLLNTRDLHTVLGIIKEKYKVRFGIKEHTHKYNYNFAGTTSKLVHAIQEGKKKEQSEEFGLQQLQILDLFSKLLRVSDEMGKFVNATKNTASNAWGSTPGDFYELVYKNDKYIDELGNPKKKKSLNMSYNSKGFSPMVAYKFPKRDLTNEDMQEYLKNQKDNPFGYEQAMYDGMKRAFEKTMSLYVYGSQKYKDMRTILASATKTNVISKGTLNALHSQFRLFLLNKIPNSKFNGSLIHSVRNGTPITNSEYYLRHFVNEDFGALIMNHPNVEALMANELLSYLSFKEVDMNDSESRTVLYIPEATKVHDSTVQVIKEAWESLYMNPDTRTIAEELFYYTFHTMGFDVNHNSLAKFIPSIMEKELKVVNSENSLSLNNYYERLTTSNTGLDFLEAQEFLQLFILNNPKDTTFTQTISAKMITEENGYIRSSQGEYNEFEVITVKVNTNPDSPVTHSNLTLLKSTPHPTNKAATVHTFSPAIKIDGEVYLAVGTADNAFNNATTIGDFVEKTYVKMNYKGSPGVLLDYTFSAGNTSVQNEVESEEAVGAVEYEYTPVELENTKDISTTLDGISDNTTAKQIIAFIIEGGSKASKIEKIKSEINNTESLPTGVDGIVTCK